MPEALLRVLPMPVQFHHDPKHQYPPEMPDDQWLTDVGEKGWIVFSHDRKFHKEEAEAMAIRQHGMGCFYLWGAEASSWEKLRSFVRAYDRILSAVENTQRPFIYDVAKNGTMKQVQLP